MRQINFVGAVRNSLWKGTCKDEELNIFKVEKYARKYDVKWYHSITDDRPAEHQWE